MAKLPTNRSTIKNDPFASVIPFMDDEVPAQPRRRGRPSGATRTTVRNEDAPTPVVPVAAQPIKKSETAGGAVESPKATGKQKLTVHLDAEIVNRVKNAAYWNPRLTIARIAEQGIRQALKDVEKENGGPYSQRDGDLVGGRPIK
jgi:hypothetical protein